MDIVKKEKDNGYDTNDPNYGNPYLNGMTEGVGNGNGNAGSYSYSDQDMYDYLRSESAKELLDTTIALSVARQNASKSLQTQLSSMGMEGSGYAGTQATGINTAYLRGLEQANAENASRMADINLQEQQSIQESNDNRAKMVYEALGAATSDQGIKEALALGGITYENGKFGGQGYDNLTEDQKRQLQYYVGIANQSMEQPYEFPGSKNSNEMWLQLDEEQGAIKEGTVAKLELKNGGIQYIRYSHGRWVVSTKSEFDSAENKWSQDQSQSYQSYKKQIPLPTGN